MRIFSHIISIVFQPLLMPTYAFAILFFLIPVVELDMHSKVIFLIYIFGITFFIPALSIFMMYRMKLITSLAIEERKERTYPLVVTTFIYAVACYLFLSRANFDKFYGMTLLLITATMAAVTFITRYLKISAHVVGISGVLGMLLRLALTYQSPYHLCLFLGALILTGITATARLHLNAHKPLEVYAGFAIGLTISFSGFPFVMSYHY